MPYIKFTDQEKETANASSIVDYLRSHGESVERVGREHVWQAPSGKVSINGSEWFSQYELVGGGAVNFVQKFFGLSYPDAVRSLLGNNAGEEVIGERTPPRIKPKKPFELPEKHTDMRRVYGYLMHERMIDRQVINRFVADGLIYRNNCVERKETRRTQSLNASLANGFDIVDEDSDVHMALLRKMSCEQIHKAIKKLEPQQQWLVEEIFFNGRTQVDIANELGVGKTAIRNRLQKIFEKMQKNL